jgi:hypothetical protein
MIPQEYFDKVKIHFNGDDKKTWDWFQAINPHFGMLSPMNLIKLNRNAKVMDYINKEMNSHAINKRR